MGKASNLNKLGLDMGPGTSPYVPAQAAKFVDHSDILKTVAMGVKHNLPVLMIGESGTGKTSAIRYLANQTKNGLRRVNLNGGTTADELIGRLLAKDGSTYWVDGVLTEAMRNGEWIVLDEINAALPEVLFVLQSVLDDDGYLVLTEKDDKEIVHKHKNFRLFATCNPPEYAGTKEMNKALLSRFPICINAEYPPEKKEYEIIAHHLGNAVAEGDVAKAMTTLARQTRENKESGKADYAMNTRDLIAALRLAGHMDALEAAMLSFGNKLEQADSKAFKSFATLHLPKTARKKKGELKQVSKATDMHIGSDYAFAGDVHNVLAGLTDDPRAVKALQTSKELGPIVKNGELTNACKGDKFTVKGIFYGNQDGVSLDDNVQDEKIASLIEMTDGPNKGKTGVLFHHEAASGSDAVFKMLNEEV